MGRRAWIRSRFGGRRRCGGEWVVSVRVRACDLVVSVIVCDGLGSWADGQTPAQDKRGVGFREPLRWHRRLSMLGGVE